MSQTRRSREQRGGQGRDPMGRFHAGVSGNPKGRPRKVPEVPKLLGETLAEKLWEKVPRTGPDGKTRELSAYELIIERFIEEIPNAKPKEIMAMLAWMQKLSVFDNLRAKVTNPELNLFAAEHDTWIDRQLLNDVLDKVGRS